MNWNENRRKRFAKLIERMVLSDEGTCFLVEGAKDERSLRNIGVKSPIVRVKGPVPLFDRLERIRCKKIVILVDFDRAGDELERQIIEFTKGKIDVDFELRRKLCSLLKRDLKDIEGLEALIEQLRDTYPSEFGSALTPSITES